MAEAALQVRLEHPTNGTSTRPQIESSKMETATTTATEKSSSAPHIVEMSWDPITRIVGSLGIFTKIDFTNRKVVECHSTSSIFRGYSIFMKNKDPRDAHFITSRI